MVNINTSEKYHLPPFLAPTAILSLVGTCCTANGLTDETALLIESINDYRCCTCVGGETSMLEVQVRIQSFMNFD